MVSKRIKSLETNLSDAEFQSETMKPYGEFALLAELFRMMELKEHFKQIFPMEEKRPKGIRIYEKVFGVWNDGVEQNWLITSVASRGRLNVRFWIVDLGYEVPLMTPEPS